MTTRVSITVESEKAGELTVTIESPADLVEARRHLVDQAAAGAKAALESRKPVINITERSQP